MTANTGPHPPCRPPRSRRPPRPPTSPPALTGARGLLQDEKLIFELGGWDKTGVDMPEPDGWSVH